MQQIFNVNVRFLSLTFVSCISCDTARYDRYFCRLYVPTGFAFHVLSKRASALKKISKAVLFVCKITLILMVIFGVILKMKQRSH